MSRETVKEISDYPIADLRERGIRKDTCETFGVRMSLSEKDGRTKTAIYFPYFDKKGVLCGYKKRDLTLEKHEKYHFTVIGKVGVECKLFGQQVAESQERRRKSLWYVEGEYDVMSLHQATLDSLEGTKYEGLEPFCVGLSCGTANAVEATIHNKDFIDSFEKIILGFDNDEATPQEKLKSIKRGKEATEDVAACLLSDNVYVVSYPPEYKDPNEMLLDDEGSNLQKLFAFEAKSFVAEKIVVASDISFEELILPREEGVYIPELPKLMEKTHGVRMRELTVLTGPTGCGKSTFTSAISYSLAEADNKVGMIFLEETFRETLLRMIAKRLQISHNRMKDDPLKVCTQEELLEAKKWCDDKFVFLSHFGSIRVRELMNKIKSMVYMQKCNYIMLDHLTMVVSGIETTDERKMLDVVMTELAAFCASNDVGIIAVSHLNRSIADEYKPRKGEEDLPFWVNTRKESLRGSASLEQIAWNIWGLDTEVMPDRTRGRTRITNLKNRPWGYLGACDVVKMNDETGILEDATYAGEF